MGLWFMTEKLIEETEQPSEHVRGTDGKRLMEITSKHISFETVILRLGFSDVSDYLVCLPSTTTKK